MSMTNSIIARLPDDHRREVLVELAVEFEHELIHVEHSYARTLEGANVVIGKPVGVARTTTGRGIEPLILVEHDGPYAGDVWAISASHVVRIRAFDAEAWMPTEVLAGPPLRGGDDA